MPLKTSKEFAAELKRHLPWYGWLFVTLGSFGVMESYALNTRKIVPLSHTLAHVIGTHPKRRGSEAGLIAFVVFWAWLTVHIARWAGEAK